MKMPKFETDLLFCLEKPLPKIYVEKFLIEELDEKNSIEITVQETEKPEKNYRTDWITGSSMMNLHISNKFIENHYSTNSFSINDFQNKFLEFIKPLTKFPKLGDLTSEYESTRPFTVFSTFYKTKDKYVLNFLFDVNVNGNENEYWKALEEVFKTIKLYNEDGENQLKKAVKESYSPNKKIKYLIFKNDKWFVINPLLEVGKEINDKYREKKDFRIKKPHIILNRDDFNKYFVFDANWILVFDNLETLMIQPNDVSLYSNISDTNLKKAQEFYKETILPRHKIWYGSHPDLDKQTQYYNYFELIITSLIFAYTALEAFANICIPNNYEYLIEKSGIKTIYSKEAIERKYSLREKFKVILKDIINTSDPTKESWWNDFIKLEDLRNEIIHTKQSKSEDRYSQLLGKDIFPLIETHKKIIKFYGKFIETNKKELLEEYPYNFDYDDFLPGLMTDKNYDKSYKSIHNINFGKDEIK
ncbi:hypothetical protein NH341_08780 [Tenacibaculum sp. XPcli2-G]|uniref:hypothetical protein n=1 Tax=Tenacibaculum sp. XPcli2-G TaxID=2954503 RepID=UPI002097603C|nr:hypothetical protein [Tenacibaculum sp. XPcli2-G]MCO7185520.1 hypothetical protein [Tenacibaculum sp. XPcli2-G]